MKRISMFIFLVAAMTVSHLFGGIKDKLGLGLNINAHKLYGDTRSGSLGLSGGNLLLRYRLKPALFLESELGLLRLSTQINGTTLDTDMLNFGVKAGYTFLTSQIYQPFIYVGLGALNFSDNSGRFWDGYAALGAGTEFFASTSLAVNVTADFRYTSGDGFDGGLSGWRTDGFLNLGLGFIYHFNRHSNQGEPYITVPEFDPFYFEVAEANVEEEIEGIVESTDQELNMQTLLSLMEQEQASKVEENAMTLEDDILPEPETTRETVVHRGAEIESWVYTVQPNDWLSKIAAIFYGDPMAYARIAQDNHDVIQNPEKIYAGQKLLVKIQKGMPVFYRVKKGESLSIIANRFYGDPMKFKDIFLANQDAIEDPDIIYPGQVLKIFLTKN
ncbi:LysM peptidoglycan-binding domain-containing protein [candidate division KSB1 bacterium]|nr:LysM peptidoglycan-binding domain-containing protein [candidate division KSB1 bacterium]